MKAGHVLDDFLKLCRSIITLLFLRSCLGYGLALLKEQICGANFLFIFFLLVILFFLLLLDLLLLLFFLFVLQLNLFYNLANLGTGQCAVKGKMNEAGIAHFVFNTKFYYFSLIFFSFNFIIIVLIQIFFIIYIIINIIIIFIFIFIIIFIIINFVKTI